MKMNKDELHRLIVQQCETIDDLREERDFANTEVNHLGSELAEARSTLYKSWCMYYKLTYDLSTDTHHLVTQST